MVWRLEEIFGRGAVALGLLVVAGGSSLRAAPEGGPPGAAVARQPAASAALVARGKYLTQAGDCMACHSAPGGQPYAGGLHLSTPVGDLVTPNITPDQETGIGDWTDDQFYRAMHDGVGKGGEYLYPAFPYPWYTKVTRADVLAIKAYLFTLKPVRAPKQKNGLSFPFNIRPSLAVWQTAFFKAGEFTPDPAKSEQINRGAYLVEGLGHCAECHSQRSMLGASKVAKPLQGGPIEHYYAPNITSDVRDGVGGWSDAQLVSYLKTGAAPGKGVAIGPMAETVHDSLQYLTDGDLHAIAAYLKSTPAESFDQKSQLVASAGDRPGSATYLNNCASCHQLDGKGIDGKTPPLAGNGAVTAQGPENVIRAIVGGLPAQGAYGPMPGYGAVLSDQEIADVANYVRKSWSNAAPANATAADVSAVAADSKTMLAGTQACSAFAHTAIDTAIGDPRNGVATAIREVDGPNMQSRVDDIVARVKRAAPAAKQADIVNSLTAAYCPVLVADPKLDAAQRRQRLDQFATLVYTRLSAGSS